jgi:hypothetical protein
MQSVPITTTVVSSLRGVLYAKFVSDLLPLPLKVVRHVIIYMQGTCDNMTWIICTYSPKCTYHWYGIANILLVALMISEIII